MLHPNLTVIMMSFIYSNEEETERSLLKKWVDKTLQHSDQQTIVVQRERLLATTFRCVRKAAFNWTQPLQIVFSGEDGDDQGGPRREFLW